MSPLDFFRLFCTALSVSFRVQSLQCGLSVSFRVYGGLSVSFTVRALGLGGEIVRHALTLDTVPNPNPTLTLSLTLLLTLTLSLTLTQSLTRTLTVTTS